MLLSVVLLIFSSSDTINSLLHMVEKFQRLYSEGSSVFFRREGSRIPLIVSACIEEVESRGMFVLSLLVGLKVMMMMARV